MGTEARFSYLLTAVAGGFAVSRIRNEIQRHSAVLKSAGQSPISLLPLDGVGSAAPSPQLHSIFGIGAQRVPPRDATSHPIGFGDRSWDSFKNSP